jgi:hypothetical protein
LFVLDVAIALELDPIDDSTFDDCDDDASGLLADAHIFEQPGRQQGPVGVIDLDGIQALTRLGAEIAPDRFGVDAAIALHNDRAGRLGDSCSGEYKRGDTTGNRKSAEKGGRQADATQHTHSEVHSYRALLFLWS